MQIAWIVKKTWNFEEEKILKFYFFQYLKIHKKFKQHSINIKNYTAHPHHLVHVPAKFRENTAMRCWVTVRKLNVTDRRTDRQTDGRTDGWTGGIAISPIPGPTAPARDKKNNFSRVLFCITGGRDTLILSCIVLIKLSWKCISWL